MCLSLPGPLGFGGAPLGNMFRRIDEQQADATLDAAWQGGIRLYDTAPEYGAGLSEERLGRNLGHRPRDEYWLCTKVGRLLVADPDAPELRGPWVGGLPNRVEYDYSESGTLRSFEASLKRLKVDRIDMLWIHDCAEDTHGSRWREAFAEAMRGAAKALTRLREEKVIRGWGLGVNLVEPCQLALEQADPDAFLLAGRYTLLDTPALDTLFPTCVERGVSIVAGGPFNSGLLAGGKTYNYAEAPAEMIEKTRRIAAVCDRFGVDIKAVALQFCLAHPAVATVIPGAAKPERIADNNALVNADIPDALWQALREADLVPHGAPLPQRRAA
jgi:D-threo-aldose 1-dehydrogenase